ncbi:MAG TPA: DUF2846 domain-containing protein [Verrucomicrobiae bacterium]|jgi:hypothetical protein
MKKLILLIFIACSALLVGCVASVPMTSTALDSEAKKFAVEPGKASIYINCRGGIGNKMVWQVILDGRVAGSLASDTYLLLNVLPGEHAITVTFPGNVKQQKLNVEVGRNYYYDTSVSMGWTSGILHFDPINEDQGREEVMGSKRVEATN